MTRQKISETRDLKRSVDQKVTPNGYVHFFEKIVEMPHVID